jgi:ABC-type nitrate/sulfonate/bicarbonate transport system permease component
VIDTVRSRPRRALDVWPALAFAALVLVTWQIVVGALALPRWLLPSPLDIVTALVGGRDLLLEHAVVTLFETLTGLAAAFLVGVGLAVAMDRVALARRALYPVLVASQTVPIVAIAPLLTIWFGFDVLPKVIVVALVCFFPIVVGTFDGLSSVDPDAIRLIRSMGATGWQLFWRVRWPAALPSLFSGTRIGVTYGVIGAIVGDWVGGSRGVGIYMMRAADQLLTERVFAAIVVSSLLSIALFVLVGLLERAVVPWHRRER